MNDFINTEDVNVEKIGISRHSYPDKEEHMNKTADPDDDPDNSSIIPKF